MPAAGYEATGNNITWREQPFAGKKSK